MPRFPAVRACRPLHCGQNQESAVEDPRAVEDSPPKTARATQDKQEPKYRILETWRSGAKSGSSRDKQAGGKARAENTRMVAAPPLQRSTSSKEQARNRAKEPRRIGIEKKKFPPGVIDTTTFKKEFDKRRRQAGHTTQPRGYPQLNNRVVAKTLAVQSTISKNKQDAKIPYNTAESKGGRACRPLQPQRPIGARAKESPARAS
jgi:hypothetical protein